MSKKRFTEEQITHALRQAESGTPAIQVCRQLGCSQASFYLWKKRYGGLGMTEAKALRERHDVNAQLERLRDENARLRRLVADLTLGKHIPPETQSQK